MWTITHTHTHTHTTLGCRRCQNVTEKARRNAIAWFPAEAGGGIVGGSDLPTEAGKYIMCYHMGGHDGAVAAETAVFDIR